LHQQQKQGNALINETLGPMQPSLRLSLSLSGAAAQEAVSAEDLGEMEINLKDASNSI